MQQQTPKKNEQQPQQKPQQRPEPPKKAPAPTSDREPREANEARFQDSGNTDKKEENEEFERAPDLQMKGRKQQASATQEADFYDLSEGDEDEEADLAEDEELENSDPSVSSRMNRH